MATVCLTLSPSSESESYFSSFSNFFLDGLVLAELLKVDCKCRYTRCSRTRSGVPVPGPYLYNVCPNRLVGLPEGMGRVRVYPHSPRRQIKRWIDSIKKTCIGQKMADNRQQKVLKTGRDGRNLSTQFDNLRMETERSKRNKPASKEIELDNL